MDAPETKTTIIAHTASALGLMVVRANSDAALGSFCVNIPVCLRSHEELVVRCGESGALEAVIVTRNPEHKD